MISHIVKELACLTSNFIRRLQILKMSKTPKSTVLVENKAFEEISSRTSEPSWTGGGGGSGTETDVTARLGKVGIAVRQMPNVLIASNISLLTKTPLFNSYVKSGLLYWCKTWKNNYQNKGTGSGLSSTTA